jgi:hypothetical protein
MIKAGDILEAHGEEEFLVEVLKVSSIFLDSFTGKVISFPKNPKYWMHKQKCGDILSFDESDFKISLKFIRDKKLKELGL